MPPQKKTDLDKQAWGWVEGVELDQIGRIHLEAAYRIGLKACKNCKRNCTNNPQCLTGLGEEKYIKSLPMEVMSLESSLSELRDPTQYVGLKNLGATCYVNSLIQMWFHNEDMRRIIYKWNITEDPEEREALYQSKKLGVLFHPVTAVGQLQYIFAMMQFGNRRLLDPMNLAVALSLDTRTQQDAQEFSKLLLCHIEGKLQQNAQLKQLLQRLTQGKYSYINCCSKCGTEYPTSTTFYELDLQLAATLKEAIEKYLTVEHLTGPNQYHCVTCNDKKDARRFIRLESLPETLNIQLMRFVFHRDSGQKRKLNSFIQFPEDLDMSEHIRSPPQTDLYSLVAVLSHKGSSAHSGHYIANICNSNGEWYQFSDDKVEKMQNKRIEDGVTETSKVMKRGRIPKGFLSSNTAYMLVYKKVTAERRTNNTKKNKLRKIEAETNSSNDMAIVEEIKEEGKPDLGIKEGIKEKGKPVLGIKEEKGEPVLGIKEGIKEIGKPVLGIKEGIKEKGEPVLGIKEGIKEIGKPDSSDEEQRKVVEKAPGALDGLGKPPKCDTNTKEEIKTLEDTAIHETDDYMVVERNGKDFDDKENQDNTHAKKSFVMNTKMDYKHLNGAAHRAMSCGERDFYEEMEFQHWEVSSTLRDLVRQENVRHELSLLAMQQEKLKEVEDQNTKRQLVIDIYNMFSNADTWEKYEWISSDWLSKWLNAHTSVNEIPPIDNSMLLCPHHRLDPLKMNRVKCIPAAAADLLYDIYRGGPRLNENSLCDVCVKRRYKLLRFKIMLERDYKEVSELVRNFKEPSESSYIVGADSLKSWRRLAMEKFTDDMEKEIENEDCLNPNGPQENSKSGNKDSERLKEVMEIEGNEIILYFNEDLLCEHGSLKTPDSTRKIVPLEAWTILEKYFPESKKYLIGSPSCVICEEKMENAQRAKKDDKIKARQQKDELNELYHGRNRNEILKCEDPDKSFYIVEKGFLDSWRSFIRYAEVFSKTPPAGIRNTVLLCEPHKGFVYSPSINNELYTVVTTEEWTKLLQFYDVDYPIIIKKTDAEFETEPGLCATCMLARIEQERLESLKYERATIYIKCVEENEDTKIDSESETAAKRPKMENARPSRTRRNLKGSHELKVSSETTLKELKLMTMQICGAGPYDQHLMLGEHELTDHTQSLAALGILPGSLLILKIDTPIENEVDVTADVNNPESTFPEKGFKGTELVPS